MADIARAALDTSVLIRHLTGDDPAKATRVRVLLARAARGELELLVPPVVLAELAWVLESYFRLARGEVAELLEAVLATPGLSIPDRPLLAEAVAAYRDHGVDFTDAWIAAVARAQGYATVYTFDRRHFARLQGIQTKSP
ncbi:MAG: PIN domain-containing protein [Candidatus Methylomirabilales bacterium]